MSSSDGGDDTGSLTDFINTTENDSDYTIVDTANPLNWSRLGQSIGLSIAAAFSIGIQSIFGRAAASITNLLEAISEFTGFVTIANGQAYGTGLTGAIVAPVVNFYSRDLWRGAIQEFGIFGYLVALFVILASVYILVRSFQIAGDRLSGGGA